MTVEELYKKYRKHIKVMHRNEFKKDLKSLYSSVLKEVNRTMVDLHKVVKDAQA